MIYFPNAKINLGLEVVSKRSDGFHNLETVMIPINELRDIIEITPNNSKEVEFISTGIAIDCKPEDNLVLRTYKLLQERYKIAGAKIHLHKIIPLGAGLGGGSADSAFTIKAVNQMFDLNIDTPTMEQLAAELGSDTIFFIRNTPQLVQGRGEILTPFTITQELCGKRLVIIKPNEHISTAEAYAGVTPSQPEVPLSQRLGDNIELWKTSVSNKFEDSVIASHPVVGEIKETLYELGALYSSMSGAGSAVYGIFPETKEKELHHSSTPLFTPTNDTLSKKIKELYPNFFVHQQVMR